MKQLQHAEQYTEWKRSGIQKLYSVVVQNIERPVTPKKNGRSRVRTQDRPVTCQCCGKAASLASHAFGVEPVELEMINSVSTGNFCKYTCFTKKIMDALGLEPRTDRL